MSEESSTTFYEKIGRGIGMGFVKGVLMLLAAGGIFGGSVAVSDKKAEKTVWTQAGDHILDAHNEIYSNRAEIKTLQLICSNLQMQIDLIKTNP